MAHITDLPEEVLLRILNALWRKELLKARLASKKLAMVGLTLLQHAGQILQTHPSPESMIRLLAICSDTAMAGSIREISFVTPRAPNNSGWTSSRDVAHLKDHVWPRELTTELTPAQPKVLGYSSLGTQLRKTFWESYRPLIKALEKLPYLARASTTRHNRTSALNQVSPEVIAYYDQLASHPEMKFGGPGQPIQALARFCTGWSNMEMVVGVLSSSSVDVTELQMLNQPGQFSFSHIVKVRSFVRPPEA